LDKQTRFFASGRRCEKPFGRGASPRDGGRAALRTLLASLATGAKLADYEAALQALKERERETSKLHGEALEDDGLPPGRRALIADTLLQEGKDHVALLLQELEQTAKRKYEDTHYACFFVCGFS
jgi:hypothetical protein